MLTITPLPRRGVWDYTAYAKRCDTDWPTDAEGIATKRMTELLSLA